MNFYQDLNAMLNAADASAQEQEDARETWGDDWAERSLPVESRRMVDENDVENPDAVIVWGWGSNHRALIPGRDDR